MKSQVKLCLRHACASNVLWLSLRFRIRADACVSNIAASVLPARCREDAIKGMTCVDVFSRVSP